MLASSQPSFAALLDNFHNIPLLTFLSERDSFRSRGMGPRTFSIYNGPDGHHSCVAGAFDAAHANDVLYPDLDEEGLGQVIPGSGVAMVSAIFTKGNDATVATFTK